ncbi:MAG: aminotransferase class I/II-fold pyridoxal phosphate-dependent enzyme [Cytophagales bacterium]|nr:aminotransferase class I/II-fold pyridoxal phosphate-dependent enzyme [Cytophagales bacterium]
MILPTADRLQAVSEYYFSSKLRELALLKAQGNDIINLGIGSPDLPPPAVVVEELARWAKKTTSHGYQSYTGLPGFREAISYWIKEVYRVEFDPGSEILPLMGSKEGIMHVSMAFLNPKDKVLVPDPGYPTYAAVSGLVQAEVLTYYLDGSNHWTIDMDHLKSLPLHEVKLMWLNYPNMPTGVKGSAQQFRELVQLAGQYEFLIVNDNPYSLLFRDAKQSIFQIEGSGKVCLELNSMSKSHNMAGWRLGWVTGNKDYIQSILKVKSNMDSGMFLPIQKAAIKALSLEKQWFASLCDRYEERRKIAFEILETLNCEFDPKQEGMFAWGKAPSGIDNVEHWVDELIHGASVFITPGFIFGSKGKDYIRLSLCSEEEVLQKALSRIKKYLQV